MRIAVTHTTRLDYAADVVEGVMDLRLGPLSDGDQRWERFDLRTSPTAAIRRYVDGFGNAAHLVTIARPHRAIEIVARGEIETFLADPFAVPAVPPRPLRPVDRVDYSAVSPLVAPDRRLATVAEAHRPVTPAETFEAVRALMNYVYTHFAYQPHVTTVTTTVAEVLAERSGVCQDFSHVLIGLCRAIDVPARYVSGYVVVEGPGQAPRADAPPGAERRGPVPGRGVGASHAWVEAFTPTHGWRGFDPTHNLLATASHVKVAVGRDYSDVPPTRGTFRGIAEERLAVEVVTARRD